MRRFAALALTMALAVTIATGARAADPIRIGHTTWTDNLFTTNVAKYVIEEKMGREVELVQVDPAPLYQGVAQGSVDFHTVGWLPQTHSDYYDQVAQDVISLGPVYTEARLGWVVPNYIPEDQLSSIEDLKNEAVMDKLDERVVGINPGAGLTRLSKQAMTDYGLSDYGYQLEISSGAGMTSQLKRAIDNEEWIVVTGWSPHWKFGRWDLRYIADPKGVLGGLERCDIIAREGFYSDEPEVAAVLSRMQMPIDEVQAGMHDAEQSSYAEAAKKYVESNPKRVDYWLTGKL